MSFFAEEGAKSPYYGFRLPIFESYHLLQGGALGVPVPRSNCSTKDTHGGKSQEAHPHPLPSVGSIPGG